MARVVGLDGRPWSRSDVGARAWRAEVARRVWLWRLRRSLAEVLWPAAALVIALAGMALMLSGRAAALVIALALVVWRVMATWGRP